MKLKTMYATAEEIPEGYADLYTERNGQFELTGVEGVKSQADVDRVQAALVKERNDHKAVKEKLAAFGDIDPATIHDQLDHLTEVEAQLEAVKKDGTIDETKLEPIIAARVKQITAPLEREKTSLQRQIDEGKKLIGEKDGEVLSLRTTITTGGIERAIRDAAVEAKLVATAISDAVLQGMRVFEITEDGKTITKDVHGVTPGLSPKEWLKDMQDKAPHWWPASVGGGAKGAGGSGPLGRANNPWSKEAWNLTKQGAYVREHGEDKAKTLAESVGSHLGATKPAA